MPRPDADLADRRPGGELPELAAVDLTLRGEDLRFESVLVGQGLRVLAVLAGIVAFVGLALGLFGFLLLAFLGLGLLALDALVLLTLLVVARDLVDAALHVEGALGQVVMLTVEDLAE